MDKKEMKQTEKAEFIMPKAEIIVFDTEDVVTTSGGGFIGDWDEDIPIPKM